MNKQYLDINHIPHIDGFYALLDKHKELRSYDISLYMALFQLWSLQRFPVSLTVNRTLVVRLSGIGSIHTYLKCLKRLHNLGFLTYEPSEKPFLPGVIKMAPLEKMNT